MRACAQTEDKARPRGIWRSGQTCVLNGVVFRVQATVEDSRAPSEPLLHGLRQADDHPILHDAVPVRASETCMQQLRNSVVGMRSRTYRRGAAETQDVRFGVFTRTVGLREGE